jgi:hypothetical protein
MHDLGKSSRHRVLDVVQERGVSIEVWESFCLELKSFAAEVIVDELKHSALGSAGRVDGCERSQDRLRIRGRGFVNENFRVRPKVSEVDSLQELVDIYMHVKNQKTRGDHVTYRSRAEYFAWTPSLRRRRRHLRRQCGAKRGRRTSDRCNLRVRLVTINHELGRSVWIIFIGLYVGKPHVDCKGHDGPFCIHRSLQGIRESVRCEGTTRAANAKQGRPATTTWLQLQRLGRARVIEDEGGLAVIRGTIYGVFEWNSCRGR